LTHGCVASRRARKGLSAVLLHPRTPTAHHGGIQFVLAAELGETPLAGLQLSHDLKLERCGMLPSHGPLLPTCSASGRCTACPLIGVHFNPQRRVHSTLSAKPTTGE